MTISFLTVLAQGPDQCLVKRGKRQFLPVSLTFGIREFTHHRDTHSAMPEKLPVALKSIVAFGHVLL